MYVKCLCCCYFGSILRWSIFSHAYREFERIAHSTVYLYLSHIRSSRTHTQTEPNDGHTHSLNNRRTTPAICTQRNALMRFRIAYNFTAVASRGNEQQSTKPSHMCNTYFILCCCDGLCMPNNAHNPFGSNSCGGSLSFYSLSSIVHYASGFDATHRYNSNL